MTANYDCLIFIASNVEKETHIETEKAIILLKEQSLTNHNPASGYRLKSNDIPFLSL